MNSSIHIVNHFVTVRRQNGTTNLITRALAAVGKRLETVPDPTSVFYHLPASEAHPQVWALSIFTATLVVLIAIGSSCLRVFAEHSTLPCTDCAGSAGIILLAVLAVKRC